MDIIRLTTQRETESLEFFFILIMSNRRLNFLIRIQHDSVLNYLLSEQLNSMCWNCDHSMWARLCTTWSQKPISLSSCPTILSAPLRTQRVCHSFDCTIEIVFNEIPLWLQDTSKQLLASKIRNANSAKANDGAIAIYARLHTRTRAQHHHRLFVFRANTIQSMIFIQ